MSGKLVEAQDKYDRGRRIGMDGFWMAPRNVFCPAGYWASDFTTISWAFMKM
jgi:hypothetical protein